MKMLRSLRKERGMSMKELGAMIGVSEGAVSQYETGKREADYETVLKVSELFGVTVDYLLRGKPERSRTLKVPVLGRVAAGIPIDAIEEIIDWEELNASDHLNGEYFGLVIKGHSMEPKISDGDVVIVRRQPDVQDGEIAVVLVNGNEGTVKRVKRTERGLSLISSNPAYDPMFFTNDEIEQLPVQILGKVVELRAKL